MALVYPVVVAFSVILSLIAGDGFTGPTINTADFNDIGVAQFYQFFRCLLTPITAAAVYPNQLILIRQFRNVLCADGFVGNIDRTGNMLFAIFLSSPYIEDDVFGFQLPCFRFLCSCHAVYAEYNTCDIGRFIRCQEYKCIGNILRLTQAAQGDLLVFCVCSIACFRGALCDKITFTVFGKKSF